MFWLVVISAIFLRIYLIWRDSIPFAYDMGRDLLWAKDISFYKIPTLIGPAASIWGVYFGPLWFYFLSIPLLISGGNPISAVYATATIIVLTGVLAFWLFGKILGKDFAFVLAIALFFGATLINISTFAFHANLLPLLTLLMIYFCFLAIAKKPIYLALAFLTTSLMFHADPAPAIVFSFIPLFIFFYFKLYRSGYLAKIIIWSAVAYLTPFISQLLFEIRNNLIQSRSLIAYFVGENPSLSGQLPIFERIYNRLFLYYDFFKASFAGGSDLVAVLILLVIAYGVYRLNSDKLSKNFDTLLKINIISVVIAFIFFTILITVEIKNWYLYGLTVPFSFLIVLGVAGLKKYKYLVLLFLLIYLTANISPFFTNQRIEKSKSDPAQLANQLKAIELIYQDAKFNPFSVYIYTPVIYDYPYQYLFWWQGIVQGRGLPVDFAYLPDQPAYVRNKEVYAQHGQISPTVYLIMEKGKANEFYTMEDWLKNFKNYSVIWEQEINAALIVQKRELSK